MQRLFVFINRTDMSLFEEFKPVSKSEWLAKIEKDLKGKPLSDVLVDLGEIKMGAFHHLDDREVAPSPLPTGAGWEIGEDIEVADDFEASNGQLLEALANGVTAPRFILNNNISTEDLEILLHGINLEMVSVQFYCTNKSNSPQSLLSHFLQIWGERGLAINQAKAGFDWQGSKEFDTEKIVFLLQELSKSGKGFKALTVNGKDFFSEEKPITELVQFITEGERMINQYSTEKYPPAFIHRHLQFSVSIGKNYFLQIAKLRALRMLWANIMKAYDINDELPPIVAHLSLDSQTEDANTNMISATTQAMSAIVGGVDRLTVLPSDAFGGKTSGFSRRIARNVQHILQMESYFDRVVDPAAGSYFIEKLTIGLAEKAWAAFCSE